MVSQLAYLVGLKSQKPLFSLFVGTEEEAI